MTEDKSLYKAFLMDHAQHPRHATLLDSPTHATNHVDRVCGDEVQVTVLFDSNRIADIGIKVGGCALAVAGGSVLSEWIVGKSVSDVKKVDEVVIAKLLHMDQIPVSRRNCALLAAEALKKAL